MATAHACAMRQITYGKLTLLLSLIMSGQKNGAKMVVGETRLYGPFMASFHNLFLKRVGGTWAGWKPKVSPRFWVVMRFTGTLSGSVVQLVSQSPEERMKTLQAYGASSKVDVQRAGESALGSFSYWNPLDSLPGLKSLIPKWFFSKHKQG